MGDATFHMRDNSIELLQKKAEPWDVTLVDTSETTLTCGRLNRVQPMWTIKPSVSQMAMVLPMWTSVPLSLPIVQAESLQPSRRFSPLDATGC